MRPHETGTAGEMRRPGAFAGTAEVIRVEARDIGTAAEVVDEEKLTTFRFFTNRVAGTLCDVSEESRFEMEPGTANEGGV